MKRCVVMVCFTAVVAAEALLARTAKAAQNLAWGRPMPSRAQAAPSAIPTWSTEFRLGAYRPVLATSGEAKALRELMFDKPNRFWLQQHPLSFGLEFDYTPVQTFGLLGVYGRLGYWRGQAPGRACHVNNDPSAAIIECTAETVKFSTLGTDTQVLNIAPISLGAIYRFDMLRRNWNWPVVFTARLGLDYHIWWATLGSGAAHTPSGALARGGHLGWSGAAQVAFLLTDGSRGRTGSQTTYFFAEYNYIDGRALFKKDPPNAPRLNLSDPAVVVIGMRVDLR